MIKNLIALTSYMLKVMERNKYTKLIVRHRCEATGLHHTLDSIITL